MAPSHGNILMAATVTLQTAFRWLCDECGEEHFAMPIKAEFCDEEEREEMFRKMNDMEEFEELPDGWQGFEMVAIPEEVTCKRCGNKYATENESL